MARKRANMSQAELAEALGVSAGTVGAWEVGGHKIRFSRIAKVAKVLGVPVETLTGAS